MNRHKPQALLKRKFSSITLAALLKTVDIALRLSSYRRVAKWLLRLSPKPDPTRRDYSRTVSAARLVNAIAAKPQIQASCLRRTLVTWWILRWKRIPTDIRIGVNPSTGHAWLEHHGIVVNDRLDISSQYPFLYSDDVTPDKVLKHL